jgi:hypothetical protein
LDYRVDDGDILGGQLFAFFLEYDRSTMSARDYRRKFAAHHDYWAGGRYERDYDGFPTILVVTTDKTAEDRIARVALEAAIGRGPTLPLMMTCSWRVKDPRNARGLLGPIWRGPANDDCRYWPLVARAALGVSGTRRAHGNSAGGCPGLNRIRLT